MHSFVTKVLKVSLSDWTNYAALLGRNKIQLSIQRNSQAYTYESYLGHHVIVLGSEFFTLMYPQYKKPISSEVVNAYNFVKRVYIGLLLHEVGHVLYTDNRIISARLSSLRNTSNKNFAEFFKLFHNIIEDLIVEPEMCYRRREHAPYIQALGAALLNFYNSSGPIEITDDVAGVFNYLTITHKCPTYAFTSDLPDRLVKITPWLDTTVRLIYKTLDPSRRDVMMFNTLLKLFKYYNEGVEPSGEPSGDEEGKMPSSVPDSSGLLNNPLDHPSSHSGQTAPLDAVSGKAEEIDRGGAYLSEDPPSDELIPVNLNRTIRQLANNKEILAYPHAFLRVADYYKASLDTDKYNAILLAHMGVINNTIHVINKKKSYNQTAFASGHYSGKRLDVPSILGGSLAMFKRKDTPKLDTALSFSILVDNSGSMSGTKTTLVSEALIVLSEALHRLHIPFEINGFTEGERTAITQIYKSFSEDYFTARKTLQLLLSQTSVRALHAFNGNIDEVNLSYVADKYYDNTSLPKDKNIIVLSDGATCGSFSALRDLTRKITKEYKIPVLGIGIKDDNVVDIYDNHIVFSSNEDLKELPKFLTDYLVNKTLRGGDVK